MNLLVTGGAGFIGSHLIRGWINRPEIARLINLDCLTYAGRVDNLAETAGHPKYVFEPIDLRDKTGVAEVVRRHAVTHVIHLAAETHVDRSITGPDAFIHTNVLGTFHLIEACRAAWIEAPFQVKPGLQCRFHHVSTDEVYGSISASSATEETPYAPNSPYAASKASADMLVRAFHRTYGLPVVVSNSSNNYGPRQYPEKLIPVVIKSVVERRAIPVYGDGLQVRDWLHVSDHVAALWEVFSRGKDGESYNIAGGNEWPNLRLIERICDIVDEFATRPPGHSRELITFVSDRPGHDRRYSLDAAKIRRELGWAPLCNFDDGLRETVRSYLSDGQISHL